MLKFFLRSDKLDNKIIYLDMYADFFHFMTQHPPIPVAAYPDDGRKL